MSCVIDKMNIHNMDFAEWMRRKRKADGVKQASLASAIGRPQSVISRWENGGSIDIEDVEAVGEALGDVDGAVDAYKSIARAPSPKVHEGRDNLYKFGVEVDAHPYLYALQSVQGAAAGLTRLPDADAPGEDMSPGAKVRAIKIVGDCMEPKIQDGDVVLILPQEQAKDGDMVLAILTAANVQVCKRLRVASGMSWLESENGERVPEHQFILVGVAHHRITPIR